MPRETTLILPQESKPKRENPCPEVPTPKTRAPENAGAEEAVMEEVNSAMQKLTFEAARTWLWSRIVNPAESFISSEISQLLSMLDPLQLSTVDPRLNVIWRRDSETPDPEISTVASSVGPHL